MFTDSGELLRLVEFDGRQHTTGMDKGVWSHSETLEKIQERDKIKNEFCLRNNICLVRVPYYKYTSVTIEDIFGDKYTVKELVLCHEFT